MQLPVAPERQRGAALDGYRKCQRDQRLAGIAVAIEERRLSLIQEPAATRDSGR
jgi:hypothetical protein